MAKKNKGSDKLAYGVSIFIFGILYLLNKVSFLNEIPYGNQLFSVGAILVISGLVFLFSGASRTLGWLFLISGIIIKSNFFFGWMHNYSNLIIPALVIILGLIMILTSKK